MRHLFLRSFKYGIFIIPIMIVISFYVPEIGVFWAIWSFLIYMDFRIYMKRVQIYDGREYFQDLDQTHLCQFRITYKVTEKSNELIDITRADQTSIQWATTGKKIQRHVTDGDCLIWLQWPGSPSIKFIPTEDQQKIKPVLVQMIKSRVPQIASNTVSIIDGKYTGLQRNKNDFLGENWTNFGKSW